MNKKGFTLMELLIVVVIITIFAAVAYPSYQTSVERARANEAVNMIATIQAAQQKHFVNYEEYGTTFQDINDFEPTVRTDFDPSLDHFSTDFFTYTLTEDEDNIPCVTAQRINANDYNLKGDYKQEFIQCIASSDKGHKVCSSLTDAEPEDTNIYKIY